jgi:hypothetical protein
MQLSNSAWASCLVLSAAIACQSSSDQDEPSGGAAGEDTTASGGSDIGSNTSDSDTEDSVSSTSASDSTSGSGSGSGGSNSANGSDSTDTASAGGTSGASASSTDTEGSTTSTSAPPYAHVVAVAASGDPGSFTFDVSIESADIDCSQYADWWEVLSEEGALIYRRILTHSHTDENGTSDPDAPGNTFTRDGGPIDIAADEVVIVRAHMSNSDVYNGMAMRGSVTSGFSEAPELGADFAADIEDDPPQPESCLF